MSTRSHMRSKLLRWLPILVVYLPVFGHAQVPVDSDGAPLGDYEASSEYVATGNEEIPLLSATELEDLVGPIALYPDDLLAIVLPASAYPLQIVQAGRFLDELEDDPSLQPDESWDDSVVALTNYPEVVRLLNDDLDWTWRLGEAVVAQQTDVIAAVETFRDRAYAAGNLKSDAHQTVSQDDGYIEITPVTDDVIYVPYYEPERVVVYQPRPVYYYYPRPYPVYYYPYSAGHAFNRGYFWGVTTAFAIGWHSNHLSVFHHSYHGHPYFGHSYWDSWWYRRPSINHYNNIYVRNHGYRSSRHYRSGDRWRPQARRTVRRNDERITRTRHYPGNNASNSNDRTSASGSGNRSRSSRADLARRESARNDARIENRRPEITFRDRPSSTRRSGSNRDRRSDRVMSERNSRETTPVVRSDTSRRPGSESRSSRSRERELASRSGQSRRLQDRNSERRQVQTRETRQSQRRDSEPRQNQEREARQSQRRNSEPRQIQTRETRQSQRRNSEPRQIQRRETRQSQSRKSESRRSESRKSESRKSESKSNRVASASRKEKSDRSDRRH